MVKLFEPAGDLHLSFNEHENFTNYYRELDIEKAVAKTSYKVADITYTREILASFPDRVIVIHLTASKSHSISFTAFYSTPLPNVVIKTTGSGQLAFSGTTIDHEGVKGMIRYKGIVQIKTQSGTLSSTDTSIVVKNADEATIYISIATNFNNYHDISASENERAASYLNKATQKSFETILKTTCSSLSKIF
jgi:alpha-L-fucosidase 2